MLYLIIDIFNSFSINKVRKLKWFRFNNKKGLIFYNLVILNQC